MKVEILIGHEVFSGGKVLEIVDFPFPPGIGDTIDLNGWANKEEFDEDQIFIFSRILVVKERFWCRYKGEVILQLWIECEEEE